MFNLGAGEVIIILVAALLILGPKRLPELARGIGKFVREFRRQTDEVRSVVEREFYRMDQDINQEPPNLSGSSPSILPIQAPKPPAALMAEAGTAAAAGHPEPITQPGLPAVSALPPEGTVPVGTGAAPATERVPQANGAQGGPTEGA